jgi:hypothetical protein
VKNLVLLAKKFTLMDKRGAETGECDMDRMVHELRELLMMKSDIASFVEIYKGNVLTLAFPELALTEGGKLNEVIDPLVLALAKEWRKDARPVLPARKLQSRGRLRSHSQSRRLGQNAFTFNWVKVVRSLLLTTYAVVTNAFS